MVLGPSLGERRDGQGLDLTWRLQRLRSDFAHGEKPKSIGWLNCGCQRGGAIVAHFSFLGPILSNRAVTFISKSLSSLVDIPLFLKIQSS